MALINFSAIRKNMRIQSEQQIYSRIMDARLKLESTDVFTTLANGQRLGSSMEQAQQAKQTLAQDLYLSRCQTLTSH